MTVTVAKSTAKDITSFAFAAAGNAALSADVTGTIIGTGITLISEIAVREEIQLGLLSVLPWKGEELNAKLLMIWRKDKWMSPALKDFMDMVREFVAA